MTANANQTQQLELTFDGTSAFQPIIRHQRRQSRAQWWFAQMRRVVDSALDWQPVPPARPEQIWLGITSRRQNA